MTEIAWDREFPARSIIPRASARACISFLRIPFVCARVRHIEFAFRTAAPRARQLSVHIASSFARASAEIGNDRSRSAKGKYETLMSSVPRHGHLPIREVNCRCCRRYSTPARAPLESRTFSRTIARTFSRFLPRSVANGRATHDDCYSTLLLQYTLVFSCTCLGPKTWESSSAV